MPKNARIFLLSVGLTIIEVLIIMIFVLPLIDPSGTGIVVQVIGVSFVLWSYLLFILNNKMIKVIGNVIDDRSSGEEE